MRDNRPYDLKHRSDQDGSEAKQTKVIVLHIDDLRILRRDEEITSCSHPVRHAVAKQNDDANKIERQADAAVNGGHDWFSINPGGILMRCGIIVLIQGKTVHRIPKAG